MIRANLSSLPPVRRGVAALIVLVLIGAGAICPAHAALIVTVADSAAVQGGTGAFDVTIADTGGTFQVAGFGVELSVPTASGVSFTDVSVNTPAATPYLFGSLQAPPLTFDTFPNQDFSAGDFDLTPPGFITMNPGDVFGLAHVTYQVDRSAPGGRVTVYLASAGTSVSDNIGGAVPITLINGTITLSPVATVPEPPSLVLSGLGGLLVGFARWRRRQVPFPLKREHCKT